MTTLPHFRQGDRVRIDGFGLGRVAYVRFAPPKYIKPEAYSVVLDSRRTDPNYTGTMFMAERVIGALLEA